MKKSEKFVSQKIPWIESSAARIPIFRMIRPASSDPSSMPPKVTAEIMTMMLSGAFK